MDKVLSLVGMAKKAGYAAVGEEPVGAAARAHIARVILLAHDAAPASVRRAQSFAKLGGSPVFVLAADKDMLGQAVGRSSCAMLAITDAGMAASIAKKLAADAPEQQETLEQLEKKAARFNARRREKRAHEKKLQRRAAPWSPPPFQTEQEPKSTGTKKKSSASKAQGKKYSYRGKKSTPSKDDSAKSE